LNLSVTAHPKECPLFCGLVSAGVDHFRSGGHGQTTTGKTGKMYAFPWRGSSLETINIRPLSWLLTDAAIE